MLRAPATPRHGRDRRLPIPPSRLSAGPGGGHPGRSRRAGLDTIRTYGWSSDDASRARLFAKGPHCSAIEHRLDIFSDAPEMLALCEEDNLASVNRIPLLTEVLTGRWKRGDSLPEKDWRSDGFRDEESLRLLDRAETLRPILTRSGRSFVRGAIAWIWARSPRAVPVQGFRTADQVEDLAGAMAHGPMSREDLDAVADVLCRPF